VRKLVLNSGVAILALCGLGVAAVAQAHPKPVVKALSPAFQQQSMVTADRTVDVVAGAPAGHVTQADLPPPDQVVCPPDGHQDAGWQQVPEDIRKIAKPGQCFARMLIAPKFETYRDHVMVADARTETHMVPEVTRMVERDVVVEPEHVIHKTVPAVTHTEMQTVVVEPATVREERIPARYETRTEHVMVAPERQVWVQKKGIATGAALVTPVDHQPVPYRADGTLTWPGKEPVDMPVSDDTADYLRQGSAQTVWCLQVVPAVYQDRTTRVEVEPEHVRHIDVPAVTRQERRVVVDAPEHVEDVVVPAVTEKRRVKEVVTPAHEETTTIPPVFQDVEKQRPVSDAETVWREVLCDRNASPDLVSRIQRELMKRGYNPGPVDGHLGTQTVSAMQKFEADHGLPQGQISVEAVRALGIDL